ncbi:MAG: hypothetical protein CVU88_01255 [Firmicutes bacterium HGW-Firmicutes-13]|nr:MAG: hypothetical protein CVU88_01255 [Firmicutes bacterium HGW-Firmicutes-13]
MLESTLSGKTPADLYNNEDLLTSTFFGLLQYFQLSHIWEDILKESRNINGKSIYDSLELERISISGSSYIKIHFWSKFDIFGEPDLIVEIKADGSDIKLFLVIEIKLWSLKSNLGDNDQLIKYLSLLKSPVFSKKMHSPECNNINLGVIYLTPRNSWKEIIESVNSTEQSEIARDMLYDLRWQTIYKILEKSNTKEHSFSDLQSKLMEFILKIGLAPFDGFSVSLDVDDDILAAYPGYLSPASFLGFTFRDVDEFQVVYNFYKGRGE